jgi:hypothetical protein
VVWNIVDRNSFSSMFTSVVVIIVSLSLVVTCRYTTNIQLLILVCP